jgi:ribonuclease HII
VQQEERDRLLVMTQYEQASYSKGYVNVAGIDEAGRGPLAGPVVAAACILPKGLLIPGVNDSKKLSSVQRKKLFDYIIQHPQIYYAVGVVSEKTIDKINILEATKVAMLEAVNGLPSVPDYLLVDGLKLNHPQIPSEKIIKGDQLSLSIAAASIIAKETRDEMMRELHQKFPEYGFDKHAGYGTEFHRKAIEKHGPCEAHRMTFDPIKSWFAAQAAT